jgi:sortase (surface protein transpeptidase)
MSLLKQSNTTLKNTTAIVIVVAVLCAGIFVVVWRNNSETSNEGVVAVSTDAPLSDVTESFAKPLPKSNPTRLRIPKLFIDTWFVPLGLDEDGEMEVPSGYEEVGWYTYGPTPGEIGPAIVLGHVDSYEGAGVFMYLGQLAQGDTFFVDREDGTTAEFRVTSLERYDRDEFPTKKVYGDLGYAGIRLITCSGTYDRESGLYDRVLVVYGALVDAKQAKYNEL